MATRTYATAAYSMVNVLSNARPIDGKSKWVINSPYVSSKVIPEGNDWW